MREFAELGEVLQKGDRCEENLDRGCESCGSGLSDGPSESMYEGGGSLLSNERD